MINYIGSGILTLESFFSTLNDLRATVGFRIKSSLPRSVQNKLSIRSLVKFHIAMNEAMDNIGPCPTRYGYGYGTLYGPDSHITNIELSSPSRRALLAIIEKAQGKLTLRDKLRTDIELLRGVWSRLEYISLWSSDILLDPKNKEMLKLLLKEKNAENYLGIVPVTRVAKIVFVGFDDGGAVEKQMRYVVDRDIYPTSTVPVLDDTKL